MSGYSQGSRSRALSMGTPTAAERQSMERSLDTLEALQREVQLNWRQTTGPDANPLDIALPLLDNTSVGLAHRHSEFLQLKTRIEEGLRVAVNEHFQSFNDSIGSYRNVVHAVADSKSAISNIQDKLKALGGGGADTDGNRDGAQGDMAQLNDNWKTYNEMIYTLGVIEQIQKIPGEVDSAMSEKNYARAQQLLQKGQADADANGIWELPALSNLKEYFQTHEEQLFEILVEEIHNILYSKRQFSSFNTVKEIVQGSESNKNNNLADYSIIEEFLVQSIDTDIAETASINHANIETFIHSINSESTDVDDEQTTVRELSSQEESNPFAQIHSLMTVIHKFGKLSRFVDIMVQRFGLELTQMINRVVEDTKLRHPKLVKILNTSEGAAATEEPYRAVVTQDLFWNLFKKMLFFLQNVRVMTEIHRRLTGGVGLVAQAQQATNPQGHPLPQPPVAGAGAATTADGSNAYEGTVLYKFWGILRKEIQTLLITYISNDDLLSNTMGTELTNGSTSNSKNSKKPLFQFYQVEYDPIHTTQLKHVLQDLFPGFINSNDMLRIDSPYIEDTKFLKQSKIIPSDIMNMKYILEPFLLFIQGSTFLLQDVHGDEPIQFFNEFMQTEFLPLLEDSFLNEYFDEVESVDPFALWEPSSEVQIRQLGLHSGKFDKHLDIFIEFKQFFDEICFTLNTSLQFRSEFISIIFKILVKFQDKVESIFKELFNELTNFLEPNKQLIDAFNGRIKNITPDMLNARNKVDFKNSKIMVQLEAFQNSLQLVIKWFDVLVKKVDLNKTDLNLSQVEKLRKSWFFFQIKSLNGQDQVDPLSCSDTNQLILDDPMTKKFGEIVHQYKGVKVLVDNVMKVYQDVLQCM